MTEDAIYVVGGTLTLARASLSDFRSVGVMVGAGGVATIDDTTIVGRLPRALAGHGVRAEDGTVSVSRSTHRNNIYDNGGAFPETRQLNAGGATSEGLDWSNNYWGPIGAVVWFFNPPACVEIGFPLGYVAYAWALPASPASPTKTTTQVAPPQPGQQQSQYCTKTWADLGGQTGYAQEPFEP